ncbi:hypothetical protein C8R48DRAFT_426134 [Suillus tomentosus]|nr:hypothetical protein C8R48DRAFT_426134 [Suillus tomentosus]
MPLLHIPISPFSFLLIYRSAYVTPSYTLFTFLFLSHPSSNSRHSFIYPFHLSLSFSSIVQLVSLLHISCFSFLLIHRSAHVTHHIPFSLSFSSIIQPMSLLPIPFSPFSFLLIVQPMSLLHPPFPPFSFFLRFIYPLRLSFPILSSYLLFDPRHSFIYPFHLFLGPPTSIPSSILKSTSRSCPLPPPFAHHGSLAAPYLVFRHLAFILCPGGLHLFVRTTVYTQLHTYSMITTFSLPGHQKGLHPFEARTTYTQLYTQPIPSGLFYGSSMTPLITPLYALYLMTLRLHDTPHATFPLVFMPCHYFYAICPMPHALCLMPLFPFAILCPVSIRKQDLKFKGVYGSNHSFCSENNV